MPVEQRDQILKNAERLRLLHKAMHTSERKAWEDACNSFHARYEELCYPGGGAQMLAMRSGDADAVETAVAFLEADPMFFRSGYIKEYLWKYIVRAPLTDQQKFRLESTAFAYLRHTVQREFWYMCRAMACLGSEAFWQQVRLLAENAEPLERKRAAWLSAYAEGVNCGEKVHCRVASGRLDT
jgi:hypothetical protein